MKDLLSKEKKDWMLKTMPKFYKEHKNLELNLTNPVTIQDKINWLKIYDCTDLKAKCSDKLHLRDYCIEKLGKDICIPTLFSYKNVEEIEWDKLPNSFVMKCNHGSAMNIIIKEKTKINVNKINRQLDNWMNRSFGDILHEYHYNFIDRKIIVEPLMSDAKQKDSLYDYKFWCFNGEPKLYTINDGHGHGDIMYYDMNDNEINLYGLKLKVNYQKPNMFNQMIEYVKILAKDFVFVRIDFYEIDGIVYLGELTFTPGAGMFKYETRAEDILIGNMLDLKKTVNLI